MSPEPRLSQSGQYFNLSEVQVFATSADPANSNFPPAELFATTDADSFVFSDLSGETVINDFDVDMDLLSIEGIDLSSTAQASLPTEFSLSSSANGSIVFGHNNEGTVTLEGISENDFFFT